MYQSTGATDATAAVVVSAVQDEPEPHEAEESAVQPAAATFHGTTHADVFHTN